MEQRRDRNAAIGDSDFAAGGRRSDLARAATVSSRSTRRPVVCETRSGADRAGEASPISPIHSMVLY
jgi:hypothetical protein